MGHSDRSGTEMVGSLVEEGVIADAEEFRATFESQFGVDIDEAAELEALFDEYAAEIEAVHERFAERLAEVDFFERYGRDRDRAAAAELRSPPRPADNSSLTGITPDGSTAALATLRELRDLHSEDVLTDEEFEAKKAEILDRI